MKHISEPVERDDEPMQTRFVDTAEQSSWIDPYANRQVAAVEVPRPAAVDGPRVWNGAWGMFEDELPDFLRTDAVSVPTMQTKAQIARIRANRDII